MFLNYSNIRNTQNISISIVVPIFNEEENLIVLNDRLQSLVSNLKLQGISSEVIFVDDYSFDSTPQKLKSIYENNSNVKTIRLSKNSGSHLAIIAGLSVSKGNCMVFLAGDLQDPPEIIEQMIGKWKEGADVVWAVREKIEGISIFTSLFSKLFYFILNKNSSVKLPPNGADFALLDRASTNALIKSAGTNPSLGSLIAWIGFNQTEIKYVKEARLHGKSKWTFSKKINAVIDAFVGFSFVPMRMMTYLGFLIATLGFLYIIFLTFLKFVSGQQVEGWTSTVVIILFMGGVQMIMLGILGEYLWRNLEESRKRPLFFIQDKNGFSE